ncbi:hypothetical protein GCM10012275_20840 [Longimycelium tulufanense]|uniref:SAM-dependent chlorinase/fluorinase n=1 Tax=Longimycelium tulufanense TaxID=907463 RepID=A0A8J3FTH8_9PSEU|nr:SAM-dependent chlorinase/fluorinase [Longimycelium tulufanense]GGM49795.1 hypothetical protein GCM10012275_20840 [Longimycelium tulufanense]
MGYEWVSFTTDYGLDDGFVAACHGVLARLAPRARVIDVTHLVPPQDVRRGAAVLAQTVPALPPAVHLAVVDPGVGTSRRGIVVATPGGVLVGPDNGLLLPAAEALGGVTAAHELADPTYWAPTVSSTFHGRDMFAPVTAHLVLGVPPMRFGPVLDADDLVRLPEPVARARPGRLTAEVLSTDHFGNVQLAASRAHLAEAGLRPGSPVQVSVGTTTVPATVGTTFGDVPIGELVVFVDSADLVAIARNGGSAADWLETHRDHDIMIEATR